MVTWLDSKDGLVPLPNNCRTAPRNVQLQNLLDLIDRYHMQQIINVTTRTGPPANTLDLLFTNTPDLFHSPESIDMSGTSDHNLINVSTDLAVEVPSSQDIRESWTSLQAFNFKRAHQDNLNNALKRKNLVNVVRRPHSRQASFNLCCCGSSH